MRDHPALGIQTQKVYDFLEEYFENSAEKQHI
jgi:hypothetical protein